MNARDLMLAVLGGGAVLGTLGGLAVSTEMKPPPDPPWRQATAPTYSANDAFRFVDSGPQDLSPNWYLDRIPTWKRDLAYRAGIDSVRRPGGYPDEPIFAPLGNEAAEPRQDVDAAPAPASWPALASRDDAAGAHSAADDAGAGAVRPEQMDAGEQSPEPDSEGAATF